MPTRIHRKAQGTQGLTFDLKRMLNLRGVLKPHAYLKKAGLSPSIATNLLQGFAGGLRWQDIEQLCLALNCTPNDLFKWRGDGNDLPQNSELRKLIRPEISPNIMEKLKDLSVEEAEKLAGG